MLWVCFSETPKKLCDLFWQNMCVFAEQRGLVLKTLVVEGTFNFKKKDLLKALKVTSGYSLFRYDPERMRQEAEKLPWVRSAKIQRFFPHTLSIKIAERVPIAIWQKDKKLTLVDDQGMLVTGMDIKKFPYLPLIVGDKSPERAPELFSVLSADPRLQKRLTTAILISERRWDLILQPGIKVKLPESNLVEALNQLAKIEQDKSFPPQDILSIDLRVSGRFYVRMRPQALAARRSSSMKKRV